MIAYLINFVLCSGLLLLVYRVFLMGENLYQFNRFYLLFSLVFSSIVPFMTIQVPGKIMDYENALVSKAGPQQTVAPVRPHISTLPIQRETYMPISSQSPTQINPAEIVKPGPQQTAPAATPSYLPDLLITLYLLAAGILLIRFVRNSYRISRSVSQSTVVNYHDIKLVLIDEDVTPHSFLKYVFINKKDYNNGSIEPEIICHEQTHIKQLHSLDIIFVELLQVICWFNPLIPFYRKAVQLNHEFLADEAVVKNYNNTPAYQNLLVSKAGQCCGLYLTSQFNYLTTKRRLIMMTKTTSAKIALYKQLALVPVFAGIILLFAHKVVAQSNTVSHDQPVTSSVATTPRGLPPSPMSSQSFVINGKTNVLANGKAIMNTKALGEFHLFKIKQDTVLIRNHSFVFTGTLKYPGESRIEMIAEGDHRSLTEPFFISAGYHKMTIDKAAAPHDSLEVGYGVNLQNEPVNDEYIKKYLPLRNHVSERFNEYDRAMSKCSSIKDSKKRKGCALAAEAERASIRKSLDDVLLTYTKANPKSPIVPWLLYDEIFYHGYTDCYENVFKEFSTYTPADINIPIRNFLTKQKLKAPGNLFPLTDFVKANVSKNISQNRYTLVDFWFSNCGPCISQFKELKKVYKKFNKKGFEIITVSIDKKEAIPAYKKIIEKNNYPWLQVLDVNGVKTKTIDVNSFPSGFLLDSHWKIIKTHINPDILNSFLEDNLM